MRNLRIGSDEADLLVEDPAGVLVVVEVKTLRGDRHAPEDQIGRTKRSRLTRLAARLLQDPRFFERAVRFDVVTVFWPDDGEPRVEHIENAFEASW